MVLCCVSTPKVKTRHYYKVKAVRNVGWLKNGEEVQHYYANNINLSGLFGSMTFDTPDGCTSDATFDYVPKIYFCGIYFLDVDLHVQTI